MSPPDPLLARALVRWQHAAGPFWPYVLAVPLVGELALAEQLAAAVTRHSSLVTRHRSGAALAEQLATLAEEQGTAIFVDQPPTDTLPAAPALNRLGFYVVPIIQRWAAAPAVLPCGRLLARLVACSFRLIRPAAPRGVVFLLDGDRAGRPGVTPGLRRFDNRYVYPLNPFPPPAFLKGQGVEAVRWVPRSGVARDLEPYARQLTQAGLSPTTRNETADRESVLGA